MKHFLQKSILLVLSLLLSGTSFSQKTMNELIDQAGEKYVKKRKNHALVIGVIKDGKNVVKSYGRMSKKDLTPADVNTVFEIGAATSVFTTTLMQLQADKDLFQVHDLIKDHSNHRIPSFYPTKCVELNPVAYDEEELAVSHQRIYQCYEDPMAIPKCICFCDLASHVSGLPASPDGWYRWKANGQRKFKNNYKDASIEKFYTSLKALHVYDAPGMKYIYSDFGIALLGNAVSEISGMPYEQLLQKELLDPLGMKSTRINFSEDSLLRIATGHDRKGLPVPAWNFDAMAPAAGLKSTMNDLLIFARANLDNTNKDLENAFLEVQQSKVKVNSIFGISGRYSWIGYAWFTSILNTETNLPVVWVSGGTGGFRSFIGFIKDTNTAVVILSNSANSVNEMGFDILEIINPKNKAISTKKISTNHNH